MRNRCWHGNCCIRIIQCSLQGFAQPAVFCGKHLINYVSEVIVNAKSQMPNEEASAQDENKRTRLTVFCVNFTVPSKNLQIRSGRTEVEEMCRIIDTFSLYCVPPALQEPSMGMDWFRAFLSA